MTVRTSQNKAYSLLAATLAAGAAVVGAPVRAAGDAALCGTFGDGVGVDSALSWISAPGRFDCPATYSNESFRYVADLMAGCGLRHVRERLKWADVEPSKGEWNPGRYLENAEMLAGRGMAVSGMFHDAARHALPAPKLPRDLAATFSFCKALAETFGDRMEIWEFWNEEDIGFTAEGAWDYAAAFKAAALGFRAGGFRGIVAPGALCREDRGDYERTLWRNGIAPFADAMNFHTYCAPSRYPALFAELRRFMDGFGVGDLAILLTECGTNQEGDAADAGPREGLKRHSPLQEAVQEEFAVKSQILTRMEGVMRNYFFVFGAFNERGGEKDWGILRRDGSPKPAAAALRQLLAEVGDGVLAGEVETSDAGVRAFRFDMPDGSAKLAFWRRTELDDGADVVRAWNDAEAVASVALDDGVAFPLRAARRPRFAPLPRGRTCAVARPALPVGRVGAAPDPGADLTVVLRADFDASATSLGGNKSVLEMKGDATALTLQAWNLSPREKRGRLVFDGRGAIEGLPDAEVILPPMGCAEFRLRYATAGEADPLVSFAADFGEGRATPLVVPVFSETKFLSECDVVECKWNDPARWKPYSSADSSVCEWDESEGAMHFRFRWKDGASDRWLFPGYSLDLPREALDGARLLSFRVKSAQDKVENDWKSARVFFGKGRDGDKRQFMCPAPTHDWETKYIEVTDAVRAMGAGAVGIGGHPKGKVVDMWVKDIRVFREKGAVRGGPFDVRDFGASGDGAANDTAAVQAAIDAATTAGGGEVRLPAGTYRCGSLFLKSGVDFHLAEGATLLASPDPADYNAPDVFPQNAASPRGKDNTSGGHLLLCVGQERVTVRGPGGIRGNAPAFLRMPDGSHPPAKADIPWRPGQMLWFAESRDVSIRDIELADAPYWSCFLHGCEDVTVENARIRTIRSPHTYNGDGLDIDCCRRVRVRGCDISTADDAIAIRANARRLSPGGAGGAPEGVCAGITVEDCTLSSDCNAVRFGVGNGTIRDCAFRGVRIRDTRVAVNAVGAWSRPSRGVDIKDVSFEDVDIDAEVFCKFYYKHATGSVFDGIRFRGVRGRVAAPSIFDDTPERPFRDLAFEDVALDGETSPRVTGLSHQPQTTTTP